jgi:hypothetical protein
MDAHKFGQGSANELASSHLCSTRSALSVDQKADDQRGTPLFVLVRELLRKKEIVVYVFKRMRTLGPDQSAFSGIAWRRALNGGSEGRTVSRVSLNVPGRSGQQ